MTALASSSAAELFAALEPYATIRRFPGHLRVVDLHAPYLVDEPGRRRVGEMLQPLLQNFLGTEYGPHLQPDPRMFTVQDRMLLVVGAKRSDLRCWITYRMLAVHRRPVMWVQAIVTRPGLETARVVPLILGTWVLREWLRHRGQTLYAVTLTRNGQFLRYSRAACGEDGLFPRADGAQPPEVRDVVETVGGRMARWLRERGGVADAWLDADAQVVRNTFAYAPRTAGSGRLGPGDAYVMVGRVSARTLARQLPRVPDMLRARRRAEARLGARPGGGDVAQR